MFSRREDTGVETGGKTEDEILARVRNEESRERRQHSRKYQFLLKLETYNNRFVMKSEITTRSDNHLINGF